MGIDFNNLLRNLGKTAASIQNDKSKIDTKTELNTFVSGWDAIKAKAETENSKSVDAQVDIKSLEGNMKSELASLMGADFAQTAGVENQGTAEAPLFSDEDISLENMMALLSPEDGVDIDKLREYNKIPMQSTAEETQAVDNLNDFGFDTELTNILMESAPGAVKYISDAIKSGRADAIGQQAAQDAEEFDTAEAMDTAYLLKSHSNYEKQIGQIQARLQKMSENHDARMKQLTTMHMAAQTEAEKMDVGAIMVAEEISYNQRMEQLGSFTVNEDAPEELK